MDYEEFPLPPHQGLCPTKLRSLLFTADELHSVNALYEFKDVDMVAKDQASSDAGSALTSSFEIQQKTHYRMAAPSFSKPPPSKWDNAHKWIASPNGQHRQGKYSAGAPAKKLLLPAPPAATKVVVEVVKKEVGGINGDVVVDECFSADDDSCAKSEITVEKSVAATAVNLSRHDPSASSQSSTSFVAPPSTVQSVSMRDMGTEMTPIASQEPSRTGTPTRSTTPFRSPNNSPPRRSTKASSSTTHGEYLVDAKKKQLSEKELQLQTRREIIALGTQLGKMNIAAWASKEEEELAASVLLKNASVEQQAKVAMEMRAAAWEEAEKAKYLARFKQEEIRIQAWENHQKAKTEAEMKRIEAEVERIRARAHDKLMQKLAAAKHKAEEKRAAAEARRSQQASRTAEQADYIRATGQVPSTCCCCCWGC